MASSKLEFLAAKVASGASVKAAAAELGLSERHAYRMAAEVEFKQLVASIRSEALSGVVGELGVAAQEAVRALRDALGGASKPAEKIQAARAILSSLAPLSELCELRSRLDALEQSNNQLRVAR
ncbi:MAG: hypothetical protein J0M26_05925 [Planctomycetes bacterium]|nr:hypothetical protein [Planctomycetota bacterium]